MIYLIHKEKERADVMKNLIIFYSRRGQNYVNGSIKNLSKGNAELITEFISEAV